MGGLLTHPGNAPSRNSGWSLPRVAMLLFLLAWPALLIWLGYTGWGALQGPAGSGAAFDFYKEKIRHWLAALGPLAPLAFILMLALQVLAAPIPGEATGFLGGFLFGVVPGFCYTLLGLTLGSALAFGVARGLGSRFMAKLFRRESLQRFDALFSRSGPLIAFLLFLFPGAPKDYLCLLLGLSKIPFKVFIVLVAAGRAPAVLLLTLQGAKVYEGHYLTFFILLGVTLLAGALLILFRDKLYRWLSHWGGTPDPPPP